MGKGAGKGANSRSKERRKKVKQAKKAAIKAKYAAWAASGVNSKSKRHLASLRRERVKLVDHPLGQCGNPGCKKCFGWHFSKKFFLGGKPHGMPQRMYKAYSKIKRAA